MRRKSRGISQQIESEIISIRILYISTWTYSSLNPNEKEEIIRKEVHIFLYLFYKFKVMQARKESMVKEFSRLW